MDNQPEVSAAQLLAQGPVELPDDWGRQVNRRQRPAQVESVRHSVIRGAPLGAAAWCKRIAERLGLQSSLRPRGRPRKDRRK